jgi:hypothetical protein
VCISHLDADTFVGLLRLLERPLPKVDFKLMEQIDLNGSSVCEDKFDKTLLYMVGIGELARKVKFPRVSDEPQDVTEYICQMLNESEESIISTGEAAQEAVEAGYEKCFRNSMTLDSNDGAKGIYRVGELDIFDPSRPYQDDVNVVVVYRDKYKSISIYCNPKSKYEFAGKTIAGIEFAGHPKACGSPRGVEMSFEDAVRVFFQLDR